MFMSKEDIASAAALAQSGDPAAKDSLQCYCSGRISGMDRDELVAAFRRYAHDASELAKAHGQERREIDAEMEATCVAAARGDAYSIWRLRAALLSYSVKIPHAVFLTLQSAAHLVIGGPGNGPADNKPSIVIGAAIPK